MAQAFCDVSYSFLIESSKFTPRPKVDSGLVRFRFKPLSSTRSLEDSQNLFDELEGLTRKFFRHKNKKLESVNLPWAELGIDPNLRPHHLTPEILVNLAGKYESVKPKNVD